MGKYKKISSSSGAHGEKYENNLILMHILDCYLTEENFEISHGDASKLKVDDIICITETSRKYIQAKHAEKIEKNLTIEHLFGNKGEFSINVYMEKAYQAIFQEIFSDIRDHLEKNNPGDVETVKDLKQAMSQLSITNFEQLSDDVHEDILAKLDRLDDKKINELLTIIDTTCINLITNRIPNGKLISLSTNSEQNRNYQNNVKYYNFSTDQCFEKIQVPSEPVNVPKWFMKFFLKKFHLVIIKDNDLDNIIDHLLKSVNSILKMEFEQISYNDMYGLIENWKSGKKAFHLTRMEVADAFLSYIISEKFKQVLKTNAVSIKFDEKFNIKSNIESNQDPFFNSIASNFIVLVETPTDLLDMKILQQILEEKKLLQTLFIDSRHSFNIQELLINAFLHKKYTHLICGLDKDKINLESLLNRIILKIDEVGFSNYKKIIVFCNKSAGIGLSWKKNVIKNEWYKNYKLNAPPDDLDEIDSLYIPRYLSFGDIKKSEEDFMKHIIENKKKNVIISDSPGMGKTTVLSSLAIHINMKCDFWAITIRLNDFAYLLDKAKHVIDLKTFLDDLVADPFKRQICEIPDILILMVDGFDEISPDYKDIVTNFLKYTESMENVRTTIVTTRRHLEKHLEEQLHVEASRLEPFSDRDVRSLICKYDERWKNFPKKLVPILINLREFLKIPLHAKMFAEHFSELDNELPETNFYEIFEYFVSKKIEIFIREKCKCEGNVRSKTEMKKKFENLIENCQYLALKETGFKEFNLNETMDHQSQEELCITGILELFHGEFRFVHKSFEDFFFTKWMISVIRDMNKTKYRLFNIFEFIIHHYDQFLYAYTETNWHLMQDDFLLKFSFHLQWSFFWNNIHEHRISCLMSQTLHGFIVVCFWDMPFFFKLLITKIKYVRYLNCLLTILLDEKDIGLSKSFSSLAKTNIKINLKKDNFLRVFDQIGDLEYVELLIEEQKITKLGVLCNLKGKYDISAESKDRELILNLMNEAEVNTDYKTQKDDESLNVTISTTYFDIIKYLIFRGANINATNFFGNNLLYFAVKDFDLRVVKYVLNHKANLYQRNDFGIDIMDIALRQSSSDIFKYLTSQMININELNARGENVLHVAVEECNVDAIEFLINHTEIDINKTTDLGENVLHLSAYHPNLDLIKYLVDKGININQRSNEGKNVLHIAVATHGYNLNIIEYLISIKVNMNEKTNRGFNLLHIAIDTPICNLRVIKYLISLGINIHEKTNEGENVLHIAIASRGWDMEVIEYLISVGVNINERTNEGENVLHIAVRANQPDLDLIHYLITHGIDINEKTNKSENVLHIAAHKPKLHVIQYLVSKGVKINEKTIDGESELHIAARSFNSDVLFYLNTLDININN